MRFFPVAVDLQRAREDLAEARPAPARTLGYDASDPLARVIAERIVLNVSDAGIALQPLMLATASSAVADIRLVRMPLPSLDAGVALAQMASLGLPQPKFEGDSANNLFVAESALLQSQRVIPLLHVRTATALRSNVMGWLEDPDGSSRLQSVWLETGKP